MSAVRRDLPAGKPVGPYLEPRPSAGPGPPRKPRAMLLLAKAGCKEGDQRQWFPGGIKFDITDFEIVVSATKK